MNYSEFFKTATQAAPYAFQVRLAEGAEWPELLEAPTGSGKTEAIVLAWLWRRHHGTAAMRASMPRRLAYVLPMRVLVEQTEARVRRWVAALGLEADLGVHVLMGGETDNDWDLYPEREAILIGTQDMLLSRALNRGYSLSRSRWPMPYGLLNNDCLWVFDEVQLMGSGLDTTAQLAAFRERFGVWGAVPSLWVSATLRADWLSTVDFRPRVRTGLRHHALSDAEWNDARSPLHARLAAGKVLHKARSSGTDAKKLAAEVLEAHQAQHLTLVIVNTVKKAAAIYQALATLTAPAPKRKNKIEPAAAPELILLHSRFRASDRQGRVNALYTPLPAAGRIVVSTQVVEAGVDLSARVLFTELSPWSSFTQRVGRCNRRGEYGAGGEVRWIDLRHPEPYEAMDLAATRVELARLSDVGPRVLRDHLAALDDARRGELYPHKSLNVVRRRTIEELFDTTADLSDADLDISPYIREGDDNDAQVFWRSWPGEDPNKPVPQPPPERHELCAAPVRDLRELLKKKVPLYRWDFLEGRWEAARSIVPGERYLIDQTQGCYTSMLGWAPESRETVPALPTTTGVADGNGADAYSEERRVWQTIAGHTNQVVQELQNLLSGLGPLVSAAERDELLHAARWHDWGKAHPVFQTALTCKASGVPALAPGNLWAKSNQKSERYSHPGFRHELASALGMLSLRHSDLAAYLVAAHHGKVRTSIRSMPNESPAPEGGRFARGIWEGDELPPVHLGAGTVAPAMVLSLTVMDLGLTDGQPSWAERVIGLLNAYGPYRLAYLETLLCAADRRASAKAHLGGEE
ncbi:MAG: DEAD/DEAH box helicase [Thermoflexales bacterium]|nr:DEAD/DEAH box helicase [Thermoflexales bacterium]